MRRALVAGHVCVDLRPRLARLPTSAPGALEEIGPLAVSPGGCVSNTGAALAGLGTPVEVVGDAGDDELGRVLVALLAARGVDPERIRLLPGASTSYTIVVQPDGHDRSFWHHVGANAGFDGTAVDLTGPDLARTDLLHVGYPSLLPALAADGGAGLHALLARARAAGLTTSLDLAVLDPAGAAREDWGALLRRVLPLVDVLTPSVDDIASAFGPAAGTEPDDQARRLVDLGAAVVMVTAGSAGAHLCTAGTARLAAGGAVLAGVRGWNDVDRGAGAPDVPVCTTVGTGDAASAGLLHGLLTGLRPDEGLELAMATAGRVLAGQPPARHTPAGTPTPSAGGVGARPEV
jgi:sugar/nucleoside kinase (ribokinase family)